MIRRVTLLALLAAPLALAGATTLHDPAGDVTMTPLVAGQGVYAPLPAALCHDARVDLVALDAAADDESVVLTLRFASGDGPACDAPGAPSLDGERRTQVRLGFWGDPAWMSVTDSAWRGTGCLALGEVETPEGGLMQFEATCVRSEASDAVTYVLGTMAEVTSDFAPPLDLRTLAFGRGSGTAYETATDASGVVGFSFRDTIPIETSPVS